MAKTVSIYLVSEERGTKIFARRTSSPGVVFGFLKRHPPRDGWVAQVTGTSEALSAVGFSMCDECWIMNVCGAKYIAAIKPD